jgi:hypothetical protein
VALIVVFEDYVKNGHQDTAMDIAVSDLPHMDKEGLEVFQQQLATSVIYLEYGSGGSTVYASTVPSIQKVISIESDKNWTQSVKASVAANASKVHLEHCDIGEVGQFGHPVGSERFRNYHSYATRPWVVAKQQSLVPDTILVDGRFRVACFLYSLLCARVGTRILFDDYRDRPNYFVVEQFCPLDSMRGRLAIFVVRKEFCISDLVEKFAKYSVVVD